MARSAPQKQNQGLRSLVGPTGPLTIGVTCKHCVFYNRQKTYDSPCSKLGVLPESLPCKRFTTDPYQVNFKDDDGTEEIAKILPKIKPGSIAILMSLLLDEAKTRRRGYHFGQKVYVRIFRDDYISNYAAAWVVKADKTYAYLQARHGFRVMYYHRDVLNKEQWAKKKKSLLKQGLVKDPKFRGYTKISVSAQSIREEDYEPPTIDMFNSIDPSVGTISGIVRKRRNKKKTQGNNKASAPKKGTALKLR